MCHVVDSPHDKYFRYNNFEFYPDFGLNFQLDLNRDFSVFTGWNNGGIGYSYSILNLDGTRSYRQSDIATIQHFPLGFQKHLKTVKWGKLIRREKLLNNSYNRDDLLYLVLFRLRVMGGVQVDYKNKSSSEGVPYVYEGQSGIFTTLYTVSHRWGSSVFLGLNLQFFNYNRDHFQLMLFYMQGVDRKFKINLDYTRTNGSEYHALLGTRGSYFGIQLAYPFKLITFKKSS